MPVPPPPPPPAGPAAGDLTTGWRYTMAFAWVAAIVAYAAVWGATRQLGLSTWWLGPRSAPRLLVIRLIPFIVPVAVLTGLARGVRWIGGLGALGALAMAGIGIGDLGSYWTIGVVELVIAAAVASVSLASLSGTYRRG